MKGFGGGFGRRALGPWGESIIKQFVREAVDEALKLEAALARLRTRQLIAMMHYAPIQQTVEGEPLEIYPFLGSSRLEEPISRYPVTFVLHGHAHRGQLEGKTQGGVPVYNVSLPLLTRSFADRPPFRVFEVPIGDGRLRHAARASPPSRSSPTSGAPATRSPPEGLMETSTARAIHDPAADFYIDALKKLQDTGIPFLVGGAFAFSHYSHVPRDTKDVDIFVKPDDCPRVLEAFAKIGYETEIPFPHWLGKIHKGEHFIDVIFSSGNGIARVDDLWFDHAPRTNVLGIIVRLSPVEEMIWSKSFILERERFDGADVLHLLRETGPSLDWPRLLMRFGDYWRVLLSHLILFGFVYPDKRQNVPSWVMEELMRRLNVSRPNLQNDVCYGTLLSREQYLHDLERWKYRDAREQPEGPMTREQLEIWTAAINKK